jgi:hypothetical protein
MGSLRGMVPGKLSDAPVQMLALLEGYRHSLKRAERFLLKAGKRDEDRASR